MVGVSTIWNITNSYRNQTEGRKQFFITKEYEEIYNEQKLKLEGELERANLRYNASKEAANQAPIQLRAAQDAYRQSKARYDNGLNTIIELTQTFSILNRSEVDLTVANGNTWRALLSMAAATGNLDLFIQNIK
jgi:outer membrane protein